MQCEQYALPPRESFRDRPVTCLQISLFFLAALIPILRGAARNLPVSPIGRRGPSRLLIAKNKSAAAEAAAL